MVTQPPHSMQWYTHHTVCNDDHDLLHSVNGDMSTTHTVSDFQIVYNGYAWPTPKCVMVTWPAKQCVIVTWPGLPHSV